MKDLNTSALGIDISGFQFTTDNPFGYFIQVTVPLPLTNNLENDNTVYRLPDYVIGPAFMYKINTNLVLQIGLGADFKFIRVENNKAKRRETNIIYGIATDIGLKYNFTDALFFSIGSKGSYGYYNDRVVRLQTSEPNTFRYDFNDSINNFSSFAFAPYIDWVYYEHKE